MGLTRFCTISDVKGNLTLDLSSPCVNDTLGHTFMPCFSIEGEVFCVFPGHSNALRILAYDILPVLSRPSWSSLKGKNNFYPIYCRKSETIYPTIKWVNI